jgi:radical SAM superfamily enzyme YgiQ (UPF0313 family)
MKLNVLLISTYEMGRQPFGLASPAAWLRQAGFEVRCLDLSVDALDPEAVRAAGLIAFYVPMHMGTRMAIPVIAQVRRINPKTHLCCYGLYAPVSADYLRRLGVDTILGGEFEAGLLALAQQIEEQRGRGAEGQGSRGAEETEMATHYAPRTTHHTIRNTFPSPAKLSSPPTAPACRI